jgi:septal ring factor EnvC (AmiA/AmiB activator)
MRKLSIFFVMVLLSSLTAPSVFADNFADRLEKQQSRIDQGISSGELTRKEAAILQDNLNVIKEGYARLKHERERLDNMLDKNSEMIRNKKHNPVKRLH